MIHEEIPSISYGPLMCSQHSLLSFMFDPDWYLGNDPSCGESAKLANVID